MTEQIAASESSARNPVQISAKAAGVRNSCYVLDHAAGVPSSGISGRAPDQVEVSVMATYLGKLAQLPTIRRDLVASVRDQIAAGTYDTPEKLDSALGEMMRDLRE